MSDYQNLAFLLILAFALVCIILVVLDQISISRERRAIQRQPVGLTDEQIYKLQLWNRFALMNNAELEVSYQLITRDEPAPVLRSVKESGL